TRYRSSPATWPRPSSSTTDSQVPGRWENRPPGLWTASSASPGCRLPSRSGAPASGSGGDVRRSGAAASAAASGWGPRGRGPRRVGGGVGGGEDGRGFTGVAVLVEGAHGLEAEPGHGDDQHDNQEEAGHRLGLGGGPRGE